MTAELEHPALRVASTVAIVVGSCLAIVIYQFMTGDPVGADGHRCSVPTYVVQNPQLTAADLDRLDPDHYARSYHVGGHVCSAASLERVLDLRLHPVASTAGVLIPAIILAPFIYYCLGGGLRRMMDIYEARKAMLVAKSWKTNHVIAFGAAVVAGGAGELILGYTQRQSHGMRLIAWINYETNDAILWFILGATLVGGSLYAWRLFSD